MIAVRIESSGKETGKPQISQSGKVVKVLLNKADYLRLNRSPLPFVEEGLRCALAEPVEPTPIEKPKTTVRKKRFDWPDHHDS